MRWDLIYWPVGRHHLVAQEEAGRGRWCLGVCVWMGGGAGVGGGGVCTRGRWVVGVLMCQKCLLCHGDLLSELHFTECSQIFISLKAPTKI